MIAQDTRDKDRRAALSPLFAKHIRRVTLARGLFVLIVLIMSLPFWKDELLQAVDISLKQQPLLKAWLDEYPVMRWLSIGRMESQIRQLPYDAFLFVILYAALLAMATVRALYGISNKWTDRLVAGLSLFPNRRPTAGQIAFSALASYGLSIWAFGLLYYYLRNASFQPAPFHPPLNEGLFTWIYFSVVTMATVGYGEITPETDWARGIVSAEIMLGVAYQVFFFSIVASFVRESNRPTRGG
jgi:voltage-gated potassium channel Kch